MEKLKIINEKIELIITLVTNKTILIDDEISSKSYDKRIEKIKNEIFEIVKKED